MTHKEKIEWRKEKRRLEMYADITALLLILAICLMNLTVNAAETDSSDIVNINDIYIFNTESFGTDNILNRGEVNFSSPDNYYPYREYGGKISNYSLAYIDYTFTTNKGNTYNITDFPYCYLIQAGGNYSNYGFLLTDSPSITFYGTYLGTAVGVLPEYKAVVCSSNNFANNTSLIQRTYDERDTVDGNWGFVSVGVHTYNTIVYCNGEVFDNRTSWQGLQFNYLLDNYNNYITSIGGNPNFPSGNNGETVDNNMVLYDCDFIFNYSKPYNAPLGSSISLSSNSYPKGNIDFTCRLTDYQENNPDKFYLTFSYYLDLDMEYTSLSDNPPFYKTSTGKVKTYSNRFNLASIDVSLTEFISNGYSYSNTWEYLFKNMTSNNRSLYSILQTANENGSNKYNKFNMTCTAFVNSYDSAKSSGYYTEWINPITNKGLTTDKGAEVNKNPYYPSEEDQGKDDNEKDPSNNNQTSTETSTSVNNGGGSVVVNVTQTNNNNQTNSNSGGSSSSSPGQTDEGSLAKPGGVVQTILGNLTHKEDRSEELQEGLGVNNWFKVMGETFSFIPEEVWTLVVTSLGIMFGVMIAAFIIRIILDLL